MHLIWDNATKKVRTAVLEHLDTLASYTGTDIFLLSPKLRDTDSAVVSSYGYATDSGLEQRFRVCIYGDMESTEHAKTRVLIMIDQIVSFRCSLLPLSEVIPLIRKSSNVTWTH
jgi:hypothetical protein